MHTQQLTTRHRLKKQQAWAHLQWISVGDPTWGDVHIHIADYQRANHQMPEPPFASHETIMFPGYSKVFTITQCSESMFKSHQITIFQHFAMSYPRDSHPFPRIRSASLGPRPFRQGLDRTGRSRVGLAECMVLARQKGPLGPGGRHMDV